MGVIAIESLVCVLMLFTAIYIMYLALDSVSDKSVSNLRHSLLHDKAASAQLVVSVHRYAVAHGASNITIECPLMESITCTDDTGNSYSVRVYTRKGGGN